MLPILLTAAYSYLLGSIPSGYLLVRVFRGQDVRQSGSGNIGATNVSRTSPALGVLTLILDAVKGMAAVLLTRTLFPGQPLLLGIAALVAVIGHMFPIWLKFRGGKGVATGLGSFALLFPKTILVIIGIFVAIFLIFRYVSLASILAVALLPLLVWTLGLPSATPGMLLLTAAASLLIVAKHHQNIRRLLAGTEPRWGRK
ncbi:MAG: glycerol-3-phosphate 1-O-acyltransferase PlsY [Acidobacteriia bacterium]|nr:glycerol-3-phosphate 1-O-acyltransferase PlsY [Terriglobia bacterium]